MITLSAIQELRELDKTAAQQVLGLLAVGTQPDMATFFADDEPSDFYRFFFEVLMDNAIPCAIDTDWRWNPEDIFGFFTAFFPNAGIDFINSEYDSDNKAAHIHYQYNGDNRSVVIDENEPDELMAELIQYVPDKQAMAIDFGEDRYSWLIVPKGFDLAQFCTITGLATQKSEPAEPVKPDKPDNFIAGFKLFSSITGLTTEEPTHAKLATPEYFAEGFKQKEKIFFIPKIIYVTKNGIGYNMYNQHWAGRVLPGQTIREGITTELLQELRYNGRFNYQYDSFADTTYDRKGGVIKRYRLTVYLYDNAFQSKMVGSADIKLQKVSEQQFQHPDA